MSQKKRARDTDNYARQKPHEVQWINSLSGEGVPRIEHTLEPRVWHDHSERIIRGLVATSPWMVRSFMPGSLGLR